MPKTGALPEPPTFAALRDEYRRLVDQSVGADMRWYLGHARWPRWGFRAAGVFVIVGGITLPVLASNAFAYKPAVLTGVSLTIALLTGLNTFYRWDATWRTRMGTGLALQQLLRLYEFELAAASLDADPTAAAVRVTRQLLDDWKRLTGAETEQFFATMRFPASSKGDQQA